MRTINYSITILMLGCVFWACPASWAVNYVRLQHCPEAAPGAYATKLAALPDGRLIAWDGDAVYLQTFPLADAFHQIAQGYVGDPGFVAVSPDGHTVVLGAGYSGKLYRLDASAPADYSPSADLATLGHYAGVFLTDTLLLIDKTTDDFTTCELVVFDVSAPAQPARRVMLKPPASDLGLDEYSASARLAIDAARTTVYTMGVVYELDPFFNILRNPLKRVAVSDLIDAYNTSTPLDWSTDATAIGGPNDYPSAGPAGVTNDGDVLVGGSVAVARVDPGSGTVEENIAPMGSSYYEAAYNPYTDDILPIGSDPGDYSVDWVYAPEDAAIPLPAVALPGLTALASSLVALSLRRRP